MLSSIASHNCADEWNISDDAEDESSSYNKEGTKNDKHTNGNWRNFDCREWRVDCWRVEVVSKRREEEILYSHIFGQKMMGVTLLFDESFI